MKTELKAIGIILWWLVLFGFVAPFLVSAENDAAPIIGFLLVIATLYATYRVIRNYIPKEKNSA
jgi:hypothetical protein